MQAKASCYARRVTASLSDAYRLTYADWLAFPDDGRLYEIIEGELFVTPPPNVEHQRVSREIEFRLLQHLRTHASGEVFYAPIGVRLGEEDVLEPDIVVVLNQHRDRIGRQTIEGAPDLVVEILSPGTAKRDLGPKRARYEAAAVPEYWIVDPEKRRIEVLSLRQGRYQRHGLFESGETLGSPLLGGFELEVLQVFGQRE